MASALALPSSWNVLAPRAAWLPSIATRLGSKVTSENFLEVSSCALCLYVLTRHYLSPQHSGTPRMFVYFWVQSSIQGERQTDLVQGGMETLHKHLLIDD